MMQSMRLCVYWSNVALAVGGCLLFVTLTGRGWLMPDMSPGACVRFWRGILADTLKTLRRLSIGGSADI